MWADVSVLLAVRLGHFGLVCAAVEFTLEEEEEEEEGGRISGWFEGMCGDTLHGVNTILYLEELHSNAGEHEVQQHGDQDDVADGFDGHEHALDHVLLKASSYHLSSVSIQDLQWRTNEPPSRIKYLWITKLYSELKVGFEMKTLHRKPLVSLENMIYCNKYWFIHVFCMSFALDAGKY